MAEKNHYVSKIEVEHFDAELYDLYWRMIVERQNVYVRRHILKLPRPWTNDPILDNEFITNMYRQMDPGTQYVIRDIIGDMKAPVDRVFNILMYRLMGSQATTHRLIKTTAKKFALSDYLAAIADIPKGQVFGDAYRVAGYEIEGGATKAENVGIMFNRISGEMPEIMSQVNAASNARELYDVIKGLAGFGDFLAHQVTVDLLYDPTIAPYGDNQWAMAGPGARNGMWALLKPGVKPRNMLMVMEFLRDHQVEEFAARQLEMPYLADTDGSPIPLSVCNIQSTLCEFFKYVRLWDGSTQTVRRYVRSNPDSVDSVEVYGPANLAFTNETMTVDAIADMPRVTPWPPVGGRKVDIPLADQPIPEDPAPEPQDAPAPENGDEPCLPETNGSSFGSDAFSPVLEGFREPSQPINVTINIFVNGERRV